MKDLTKRSLSILTAILMLMCMLPVAANAHGIEAVPQAQANGAAPRTETELSIPELDPETVAVKARGYAAAHTQTMPEGVAIWDGSTADAFAGGNGTEADPFLISNGSQLAYLASLVNGKDYQNGKYFKLTDDIYLNDITDWENWDTTAPANSWTSIGYYWYYGFAGNFDGDGHAVYGIYINTTATDDTGEFKGLFGCCLSGASVQNLGIECSYINACKKLAGVIGYNLGEVKNCYSNAKIVCSDENAGGIIGFNERGAFVSGCYNSGTVISSSDYVCDLGGIIGESGGGLSHEPITIVTDCYNSGTIGKPAAYKTYETGGIAGTCSAQVSHCYNSGTVYGYSEVGGIICELSQTVARDCLNEGDIIQDPSTADDYAMWYGGIAGKVQEGTVINCVNKGNVSGEKQLGGIAGTIYWVSHIYSCRNDGVVSGTADCVGGIGGILLSSMSSIGGCINNGTVNAAGQYAGGIIGSNSTAKISDCINNGAVTSSGSYTGGIAGANIMDSSETGNPKPVIGFCVNKAEINGAGNVGGLTGANGGIINDCYNTAGITGTSAVSGGIGAADAVSENINLYNIGAAPQGIIGAAENGASISGCYYLDTCAPGSALGTALTDAQMKTQSGFEGFDFENVWIMGTGDYLYPVLANKYNVAFFDIITGDEIPGCYAVTPGNMLNEADFPPVPEHEGCEFLRWDSRYDVTNDLDYSNTPIYGDIIVKARYYDSNANWISGWSGGSIPACELHESGVGIWSFAEYDMETIYFKHEIGKIEAISYAGGNLYGFFNDGDDRSFFIMDPETYEITKHGDNANIMVNAMAYNHADGIMYAVADESGWAGDSKLYTVDLDTGAITFLADLKSEGTPLTIACFAIDGEGRAYAISSGSGYGTSDSNFYSVNLETGECSLISGLGLENINQYFSCLCWDHNENRLLLSWYCYQGTGGNGIFTVDPATGALTALGQVGPECFMGCGLNFTAIWTADDLPMEPGLPTVPPTEVPPTEVPPTEVPPTEVPPTEVPPTEVPPTEVPPTEVPPTEVPPTEVPPTAEPEPQEGDVIFDIRNPETENGLYYAKPGETVTVEFTVTGEYAAHGANINFNYDPELLTIESLEEGAAMAEIRQVALPVLDYETIPGSIKLGIMAPTDPFSAQGVIYTVSFKVAETAELGAVLPLEIEVADFFNMPVGEEATPIPYFAYNSSVVVGEAPVPPTEPPTEEPPTETPTTPPTPPTPPVTGFISLAGAGIAAILAGAGVVLFKRKKD